MKKIYALILGASSVIFTANAQDFHFSQFYMSPLTLNPAMTGAINGNLRGNAIMRNQWGWAAGTHATSSGLGYRTIGASVDGNILRGSLPADDYIGLGAAVYSDKAGDAAFGPTEFSAFLAYHKSLGNKRNPQYVSIGLQGTYSQWSLDGQALYFEDQYDHSLWNGSYNSLPAGTSVDHANLNSSVNNFDVSSGLLWYASPSDVLSSVYAGIGLAHLIRSPISFLDGTGDDINARLYTKVTAHAGSEITLNDQFAVLPSIIYLKQGPASELNLGTSFKFILGEIGGFETAWSIGPWARIVGKYNGPDANQGIASDAIILATRFDVGSISVGFSYDLLVSSLRNAEDSRTGTRAGIKGGPEVALQFVAPITRNTTAGTINCPRF